ncbi:MAG: hypothetical protein HY786_05525 [Deltaproteobacteria bacterium]|nr:hypothetical protein [Deltaproteobacteria bacterium]
MRKTVICLGMILVLVTGCSTAKVESTGRDITEEPGKVIKAGVTTREEIIRIFGEPSRVSKTDVSEELVYESRKEETPTYIGGLVIDEAGKKITLKRLEILIQNGVVQSYKFEARSE